jgi:hypothetical protein
MECKEYVWHLHLYQSDKSTVAEQCTESDHWIKLQDAQQGAPTSRPLSKSKKVSHYLILSHRLSLNTITNSVTLALQSVKKR